MAAYVHLDTGTADIDGALASQLMGIGTTAPVAKLGVLSTTEQLRLLYSSTKYTKFEVDSAGVMTVTAVDGVTTAPVEFGPKDFLTERLRVNDPYNPVSANPNIGIYESIWTLSTATQYAMFGNFTYQPTGGAGGTLYGLNFTLGLRGSENIANVYGMLSNTTTIAGSANITGNMYHYWAQWNIRYSSTRNITGNYYGFYHNVAFLDGSTQRTVSGDSANLFLSDYSTQIATTGTAWGVRQEGSAQINEYDGEIQLSTDDQYMKFGAGLDAGIKWDNANSCLVLDILGAGDFNFTNGNVGISESAAAEKLDVNGRIKADSLRFPEQSSGPVPVANSGFVYTKEAATITELYYMDDSGSETQITNNGSLVESGPWNRTATDVYLDNPGDSVGIGTASPAYKLDVSGDINTTAAYRVAGTQVISNRVLGWGLPTGTTDRTTFLSSYGQTISRSPTQAEVQNIDDHQRALSQRLAALITDLSTHGLIGA